MTANIIQKMKSAMEKAAEGFKSELTKIRAGRANPAILDSIKVDYYGTPTPLTQVATVSAPEPKLIVIQAWEQPMLKVIETAIQKSDLGLNPMNDGKVVRLKIPDLTEERRKDLVKTVKKVAEEGRVAIRMHRRDANEAMKALLKDKKISEDENKRGADQVQKITDEFSGKIDQISAAKEKELMTM